MGTGRMSGAPPDEAQIRPPLLARRILARVIPARLRSTAAGDFEEMFCLILRKSGPGKAALWYWGQVVKSVPVFFFNNVYWRISMFVNYLKLALRHMRRRPEFAAVNLAGLAGRLSGRQKNPGPLSLPHLPEPSGLSGRDRRDHGTRRPYGQSSGLSGGQGQSGRHPEERVILIF